MSRRYPTVPVEVRIGDCLCPGAPHEADVAMLRPRLLPGDAIVALAAFNANNDSATIQRELGMALLRGGLVGWNIIDESGPIPLSAIDDGSLDWDETLRPIAEKANDLYTESLMRPLLDAIRKSSPGGQTSE